MVGVVLAAPRCLKGVFGAPLGASRARPGAPRSGHRTVVIRCFWGLTGVLWGARWGLARFLCLLLADFLDKLEVGLRGCTVRVCLCRLLETLVFYKVLGGVRVWRAGRGAGLWGLGVSPGASRGPAGTPKEDYRGGSGSSWRLWRPLGVFGSMWASGGQPPGGSGVSGDS